MPTESEFRKIWNLRSLYRTWRDIRRELPRVEVRDAVDYLEYDLESGKRLQLLRARILDGLYSPRPPASFEFAKSKGSFRRVAVLGIEDLLVYRHICDHVYRKAKRLEGPGVFFSKKHTVSPVGKGPAFAGLDPYEDFFELWLRYDQYRKQLLLGGVFNVLVTTDIASYFESIQHDLLLEYLAPLGLPRKFVGLLGKLLEQFKPQRGHSPAPRVGLPEDSFDCSRQLAHIFLFEHDLRIRKTLHPDSYVRWMDDQNIGVHSMTEARKVVRTSTQSLAEQRLVLNAGKTAFLSPNDLVRVFHLRANDELDTLDRLMAARRATRRTLRRRFRRIYNGAQRNDGIGHWDKILKRMYAFAARLRSPIMDDRMENDLVQHPQLAPRIFECLATRRRFAQLLQLFKNHVLAGECFYESTEVAFFETLLRHNLAGKAASEARALAKSWLAGKISGTGRPHSKAPAAIVFYWLGDGRASRTIHSVLQKKSQELTPGVARSLLASLVALSPSRVDQAIHACIGFDSPATSSFARLLQKLRTDRRLELPNARLVFPRRPITTGREIYEARAWLRLELLSLTCSRRAKERLRNEARQLARRRLGVCERRALRRMKRRLR